MMDYILKDGRIMTLRQAEKCDSTALVNFFNQISSETNFLSFGFGEFTRSYEEEEKLIEKYSKQDNGIYIVSEVDGHVAGAIFYSGGDRTRTRHTGEFGIGIAKAYWGLGIGRIMIEALIKWAWESKTVRKINLRVRTDNEKAIGLYKSLGFAIEGMITRDILINGVLYDSYLMGMPID